jgi:arabinofuranosyltransferase
MSSEAKPQTNEHGGRATALNLLAFIVSAVVLLSIARSYLPFIADDALISFRYSERWLNGQGLTFTDGERVEGYSNLLWVAIIAAGGVLTRDLVLVGRVAGVVGMVLALAAVLRAAPIRSWQSVLPALAGLAALALSHGIAIWSIGGLEQAVQVPLLAWTLALLVTSDGSRDHRAGDRAFGARAAAADHDGYQIPRLAGVLLALLVWTRPDGALFCALVALGLLIVHGVSMTTMTAIVRIAWMPAIAWLAQLAFRLAYYGDWLPNTAYVKLAGSVHHASLGAHYLAESAARHGAIVALAAIGVAMARPFRRREVIIPLVVGLGWAAYVLTIGGDIFPGRRHFLPVLVSLAFLIVATWRGSVGRLPAIAQVVVLALVCIVHARVQQADTDNANARIERWEWDCEAVMSTLHTALGDRQPLIAADPVGCVGYFGKLPTLDLMGLNDRHIARNRPASFGQGNVGHELGDGRYALSRHPDIVFLCLPAGPPTGCFKSGLELVALPEFQRRYTLVPLAINALTFQPQLWFDTASPRLGVTRSAREIRIPGFLFATAGRAAATLSRNGRLVATIPSDTVLTFDRLALEGGPWTVRAIASSPIDASVQGSVVRVATGAQRSDLIEVILTLGV